MGKWLHVLGGFLVVALTCSTAMAQTAEAAGAVVGLIGQTLQGGIEAVGLGLTVIGVGIGIGRIGGSACEGVARQPEMANKIQTVMIIAAALVEGAGFFALILCLIV